jgi:hypothetical protein
MPAQRAAANNRANNWDLLPDHRFVNELHRIGATRKESDAILGYSIGSFPSHIDLCDYFEGLSEVIAKKTELGKAERKASIIGDGHG